MIQMTSATHLLTIDEVLRAKGITPYGQVSVWIESETDKQEIDPNAMIVVRFEEVTDDDVEPTLRVVG